MFSARSWPSSSLVLVGAALNSNFLSAANVTNVLSRSAFIGIIAVGMTFVITAGGLDLSVGSMAAFIAGLMIMVMNGLLPTMGPGWPLVGVGMGAAILAGLAAGFLNGFLITTMRIEAFIVTLGTMGIYRSLVTWLADGGTLSLDFGMRDGDPADLLRRHPRDQLADHRLRARRHRGGDRHAPRAPSDGTPRRSVPTTRWRGIRASNVNRVRMLTYVFLGLLVGVATIMYVPRLGSASSSTGVLWELEAIAAVIIGGTMLKGGFGRVWGTVIGVLILSLIDNILNLTDGVSPYLNGAIQGVIIILAVILQRERKAEG